MNIYSGKLHTRTSIMLFNSYIFIFVFLPVVLTATYLLANYKKLSLQFLILASLFFYAWWEPRLVILLMGSVCFNFLMGRVVREHKLLLWLGVTVNLVMLGYFKYYNFFISSLNLNFTLKEIILPLAISFYTFEQISYLVDAYREKAARYSFIEYSFFVTFFPRLIAGPIIRHHELIPQIQTKKPFALNYSHLSAGLTIFFIGLFKKTVIADTAALYSDLLFNHQGDVPTALAWAGTLAYSIQIYFDFSGYSDMAIGLARMLNITLPLNFYSPYKASSIIDFWRRWHITLSRFLRDYVYFSLGGNRRGQLRRYLNVMITMLLGGLWHGASWTFVFWGGLHAVYLVINHLWGTLNITIPRLISRTLTFIAVSIAWVYFRATDFNQANTIIKSLVKFIPATKPSVTYKEILFIWLVLSFTQLMPNTQQFMQKANRAILYDITLSGNTLMWSASAWYAMISSLLALLAIMFLGQQSTFIYFNF